MLIKCIKNNSILIDNWWKYNSMPLEEILVIGQNYIVFGIIISTDNVYFEILTVHSMYTFSYSSILFEIVDNRLSKYFCFGNIIMGDNRLASFISFKEWINDKDFYSNLLDRQIKEIEVFEFYVKELKYEFETP